MIVAGKYIDITKVEALRFKLNSTDTNMRLMTRPFDYCHPRTPIEEQLELTIKFDDSYELDILIDALQRFRDMNRAHIGKWDVWDAIRNGFQ